MSGISYMMYTGQVQKQLRVDNLKELLRANNYRAKCITTIEKVNGKYTERILIFKFGDGTRKEVIGNGKFPVVGETWELKLNELYERIILEKLIE